MFVSSRFANTSKGGCREIRQKTFLIPSVRLFVYRLSDMYGYCFLMSVHIRQNVHKPSEHRV
jgi:hypothetical protein